MEGSSSKLYQSSRPVEQQWNTPLQQQPGSSSASMIATKPFEEPTQRTSLNLDQNGNPGRVSVRKTIDDFTFIDDANDKTSLLGKGSYGTVRLAVDNISGLKYAIKIMNKSSIFEFCTIDNLKREIKIQKRINHPHICKLHHYFEDKQNVYLVLEYAHQGSLFNSLRSKKAFSEEIAFRFFYQTCLGIDHLHKNSIIHRDLKPENLLLDVDGNIKLCDFGWSADQRRSSSSSSLKSSELFGTVDYMSPEIIQRLPHDHRVDIWCLGILLYELVHGYTPFKGNDDQLKMSQIRNSNKEIIYEPHLSADLVDLLGLTLQRNPLHRISMAGIFAHPWMQRFYKQSNINISAVLKQQDSNTIQQRLQNLSYSSTSSRIQQQQKSINSNQRSLIYSIRGSIDRHDNINNNINNSSHEVSASYNPKTDFSFSQHNLNSGSLTNVDQHSSLLHSSMNEENNLKQYYLNQPRNETPMMARRYSSTSDVYQYRNKPSSTTTPLYNSQISDRYEDDDDQYLEKIKRARIGDDHDRLKGNQKNEEESFFSKLLVAFGCVSRDKHK